MKNIVLNDIEKEIISKSLKRQKMYYRKSIYNLEEHLINLKKNEFDEIEFTKTLINNYNKSIHIIDKLIENIK